MKIGIIGAGSVGNHLAFSWRKIGADVTVCDISKNALDRFKADIYPSRYGTFDNEIRLIDKKHFYSTNYDAVFIGTPPESHLELLQEAILFDPKIICVEKSVVTPDLDAIQSFARVLQNANSIVLAGYNHRVGRNTVIAQSFLETFEIGAVNKLESVVLESWSGILAAHPWLKGPEDSYLGYTNRGGGATFEHSHGLDLWCFYAERLKLGRVLNVSARAEFSINKSNGEFDEKIEIALETESGVPGIVRQDVTTARAEKWVEISGSKGTVRSTVGLERATDAVTWQSSTDQNISIECRISKPRYDDFDREIANVSELILSGSKNRLFHELSALTALETAFIGSASILSAKSDKKISLDFQNWTYST